MISQISHEIPPILSWNFPSTSPGLVADSAAAAPSTHHQPLALLGCLLCGRTSATRFRMGKNWPLNFNMGHRRCGTPTVSLGQWSTNDGFCHEKSWKPWKKWGKHGQINANHLRSSVIFHGTMWDSQIRLSYSEWFFIQLYFGWFRRFSAKLLKIFASTHLNTRCFLRLGYPKPLGSSHSKSLRW